MIIKYLKAGYPVLQMRTYEPERFLQGEFKAIKETTWQDQDGNPIEKKCFRWDIVRGLRELGNGADWVEAEPDALPNMAAKYEQAVFFLFNYHFFFKDPGVIQAIQNNLQAYKAKGVALVMVTPDAELPPELAQDIRALDFAFPDRDQIKAILRDLEESTGIKAENEDRVIDAAKGLPYEQIENALSLALVETKKFDPIVITDLKAQALENVGLRLLKSEKNFDNLIGLGALKEDVMDTFKYLRPDVPVRGLMLLGTPGNGKTHFAEALGSALGIPVIILPLDQMMGSLVGESERKLTSGLKAIDAFGRCVVVIDEIEKGLAGAGSSNSGDGGTTQRWASILLKWLNDRNSDAYVLATCNDYSKLPAEYVRPGRWDGIYFVDGPTKTEGLQILDLYLQMFTKKALAEYPKVPDLEGYSGAEIRQVAIKTVHNGGNLEKAGRFVIPQSKSNKQTIDALREWARYRTIPASRAIPEEARGPRKVQI